jgi:hypothetical protein
VIGPLADFAMTGIGHTGLASKFVKPLDGIRNKVGTGVQVLYARGCGILDAPDNAASFAEAAGIAKKADVAIVYASLVTIKSSARASIARILACLLFKRSL